LADPQKDAAAGEVMDMLAPISGEMNFVPPPRKKSSSSGSEELKFDECLIEKLEAIDRDAASREDNGGQDRNDSHGEGAANSDGGAQGSGPGTEAAPEGRRIDLRA
jgi:hypothetical protein